MLLCNQIVTDDFLLFSLLRCRADPEFVSYRMSVFIFYKTEVPAKFYRNFHNYFRCEIVFVSFLAFSELILLTGSVRAPILSFLSLFPYFC